MIDGEDLRVGDVITLPLEVDRPDAAFEVVTLRPAYRQVAMLRDERDPTADPIPLTLDHPVRRVILSAPFGGAAADVDGTILWPLLGLLAVVGIVVSGQSGVSVRGLNRLRVRLRRSHVGMMTEGTGKRLTGVLNIDADAANRGVQTRMHWWKPQGELDIISWQE